MRHVFPLRTGSTGLYFFIATGFHGLHDIVGTLLNLKINYLNFKLGGDLRKQGYTIFLILITFFGVLRPW